MIPVRINASNLLGGLRAHRPAGAGKLVANRAGHALATHDSCGNSLESKIPHWILHKTASKMSRFSPFFFSARSIEVLRKLLATVRTSHTFCAHGSVSRFRADLCGTVDPVGVDDGSSDQYLLLRVTVPATLQMRARFFVFRFALRAQTRPWLVVVLGRAPEGSSRFPVNGPIRGSDQPSALIEGRASGVSRPCDEEVPFTTMPPGKWFMLEIQTSGLSPGIWPRGGGKKKKKQPPQVLECIGSVLEGCP